MPSSTAVAFDRHGPLLSTGSISRELVCMLGPEAADFMAALARRYQLAYTWRINCMGTPSRRPLPLPGCLSRTGDRPVSNREDGR